MGRSGGRTMFGGSDPDTPDPDLAGYMYRKEDTVEMHETSLTDTATLTAI
jgi:hypothetical protein